MNKEMMPEDNNMLAELKHKLWQSLDIIRGESISSQEDYLILYFLVLQKHLILCGLNYSDPENLKHELLNCHNFFKNEDSDILVKIHKTFEPTIERISVPTLQSLVKLTSSLNRSLIKKHCAELFDDILYRIHNSHTPLKDEFILPLELSRFICGLANLNEYAKVYNPFAGMASFGVLQDAKQNYLGQEINITSWAVGSLRIIAYGKTRVFRYILGDSINDWNPSKEKYDLIISNPPFGMRQGFEYGTSKGKVRFIEHFFIQQALEDLSEEGKIISVIPQGFLSRPGREQNLKQYLVENDLIEMIISLPGGLLINTGISTAIIVINKNKKDKGFVRFIDAKNYITTISSKEKKLNDYELNSLIEKDNETAEEFCKISNQEITENDYNLSVNRYFIKQDTGVLLSELITPIRGSRVNTTIKGKYIRIRDLSPDRFNFYLYPGSIDSTDIPNTAIQINESVLLLASRWHNLKPSYFEFKDSPIYISPDIYSFKVDSKKVDIAYLVHELNSNYVYEQFNKYKTGTTVPYISKTDLLKIKINLLPSIKEQKLNVFLAIEAVQHEKEKAQGYIKKIKGLEKEIFDQNSFLRHSIAGPLSNIKGSFAYLKKILEDQITPLIPDLMSYKISPETRSTLGKYLEILQRDITKVCETTRRSTEELSYIHDKKLFPVNIFEFLKGYISDISLRSNLIFYLKFDYDEDEFLDPNGEKVQVNINANPDLLTVLFDNLIENAEKHAFHNTYKSTNRIGIQLMVDLTTSHDLTILFSNTGAGFPPNFGLEKLIRKGSKSGISAGEGLGGWYINEVIKKLDGEFNIIDEQGPEGIPGTDLATSFEITFPIIQYNNDETI